MKNYYEQDQTPMDYGNEVQITQNDVDDPVDIVDEAIWGIMDEVIANGFSEAAAEKKVAKMIEKLAKDEIIPAVPEYEEPDGMKATWVQNALPHVRTHLKLQGDMI